MATNPVKTVDPEQEAAEARRLAERYSCEYVDLKVTKIDHDLFKTVPVDLMFRYNFVPLEAHNGTLDIALADPRNLNLIDELAILLEKKLKVFVATPVADFRPAEEDRTVAARSGRGRPKASRWMWSGDEDNADETLSIDKLAGDRHRNRSGDQAGGHDHFQRARAARAADIHIETRDQEVAIKYRIDGVLQYAMPPIAKEWHSTILSPHQSDERARHRRAARAAGRAFPRALQEAA